MTPSAPPVVQIRPVGGLGEVAEGADLAALIASAAELADGDIVVVSSKILSKALGLSVAAPERDSSIAAASVGVGAQGLTPRGRARIVVSRSGPVMAAAGVDNSNVAPGSLLLLPVSPDAEARELLARLRGLTGLRLGLVISDTAGRAWRQGQTDFALGAAGVLVAEDLRGVLDTAGQPMEVTVRALADELAAAADLVKGKLASIPVAVLRGLGSWVTPDAGPGAAALLRAAGDDWFRFGHVEAVRAALGVGPSDAAAPAVPPSPVPERLARVMEVALAGRIPGWPEPPLEVVHFDVLPADSDGVPAEPALQINCADPVALGALAQRIAAAAWSEDLELLLTPSPGPPSSLRITPR